MSQKKGKKLCWNCEGDVERDAIICRFCGVNVLNSLTTEVSSSVPLPPYAVHIPGQVEGEEEAVQDEIEDEEEADTPTTTSAGLSSFFCFLAGSFFLLFSLFLVLFSDDGVLTLRWDASYWLLYLLVASPLLFFGWRLSRQAPPKDS